MSEHGFHVHGPETHHIEHEAHSGSSLAQQIAIFTAILASIGAIVSYQGGDTQNDAMLYKNEAVLKKTQASDQWNYYQAVSNKGHLMELASDLADPGKADYYKKQIEKYKAEKGAIKQKADALEEESKKADEKSEQLMHPHHKLAQAMTLIQIAISLASITALTRKKWLFAMAIISALGGTALWVMALS
ncbi:MAG: DUF4337 domain-containing protein [Burkholderiales bacterium]|nr:DUF4337 domain-containing protein [Burkholderiales bacterium]